MVPIGSPWKVSAQIISGTIEDVGLNNRGFTRVLKMD